MSMANAAEIFGHTRAIAPTSLDVVDTGQTVVNQGCCKSNPGFCIGWKMFGFIVRFAATLAEFVTGVLAIVEFWKEHSDALTMDSLLKRYMVAWACGHAFGLAICVSEIIFIIHSIRLLCLNLCCPSNRVHPSGLQRGVGCKPQQCVFGWDTSNFVLSFALEEIPVSVAKILIAFESPDEVKFLQTPVEQRAAIVAFSVAMVQIILMTIQLGLSLLRSSSCCNRKLILYAFYLFTSCVAASPATIAMFISIGEFEIIHGDVGDLRVNIIYLIAPPLIGFVGLFIILVVVRGLCKE